MFSVIWYIGFFLNLLPHADGPHRGSHLKVTILPYINARAGRHTSKSGLDLDSNSMSNKGPDLRNRKPGPILDRKHFAGTHIS